MNETHPACLPIDKLLESCRISFSRASGPGGQNRNKVETAVHIEHLPTGIIASASERRSQMDNRKVAIQRLRCRLAVEVQDDTSEQEPLLPSSDLWNQYCKQGKLNISETNEDWPRILAETMISLAKADWDVTEVAQHHSTTASQLVKILRQYPPALTRVNERRQSKGLRSLS